jgi:NAD-dependent dihydropyrimidine dehydrogenase PreA subunit
MTVNDGLAAADPETCVECGICMEACTNGAVSLP